MLILVESGVCPSGWHLPSDAEWKQLEIHLEMTSTQANLENWRGTDQGDQLKEMVLIHWNSPNSNANNISGFTALPGGSTQMVTMQTSVMMGSSGLAD